MKSNRLFMVVVVMVLINYSLVAVEIKPKWSKFCQQWTRPLLSSSDHHHQCSPHSSLLLPLFDQLLVSPNNHTEIVKNFTVQQLYQIVNQIKSKVLSHLSTQTSDAKHIVPINTTGTVWLCEPNNRNNNNNSVNSDLSTFVQCLLSQSKNHCLKHSDSIDVHSNTSKSSQINKFNWNDTKLDGLKLSHCALVEQNGTLAKQNWPNWMNSGCHSVDCLRGSNNSHVLVIMVNDTGQSSPKYVHCFLLSANETFLAQFSPVKSRNSNDDDFQSNVAKPQSDTNKLISFVDNPNLKKHYKRFFRYKSKWKRQEYSVVSANTLEQDDRISSQNRNNGDSTLFQSLGSGAYTTNEPKEPGKDYQSITTKADNRRLMTQQSSKVVTEKTNRFLKASSISPLFTSDKEKEDYDNVSDGNDIKRDIEYFTRDESDEVDEFRKKVLIISLLVFIVLIAIFMIMTTCTMNMNQDMCTGGLNWFSGAKLFNSKQPINGAKSVNKKSLLKQHHNSRTKYAKPEQVWNHGRKHVNSPNSDKSLSHKDQEQSNKVDNSPVTVLSKAEATASVTTTVVSSPSEIPHGHTAIHFDSNRDTTEVPSNSGLGNDASNVDHETITIRSESNSTSTRTHSNNNLKSSLNTRVDR